MCGIAGLVSRRTLTQEEIARVRTVNERLAHRGPDGVGEYLDDHVALAMRRLSIIDLSGGWQPLYNEDKSLALIANGEIYNFVELRKRLEGLGHKFHSGSDCETILHLYEQHGLDFVQHLRGMFAFALWDSKQHRLVLGRDRMGEKPLYLYQADGALLFASEMKALLASEIVPFELDANAVDQYFHYQYVPEPLTPLKHVRKLDAAHLLIVDVDDWRVTEKCYWSMEDAPPLEGDPATLIREELERVSEIVIRSDVPVGVALSGGLDSSAIAALAASKYPGTMHAFSVGYPGRPEHDERSDAKALADHLGLPFHDVELTTEDMVAFFPELVYLRDDPIADISGFGYYAVNKLAHDHGVPVILQGQGGDELFWGYNWVRDAARESTRKETLSQQGSLAAIGQYFKLELPNGLSRAGLGEWAHKLGGLKPGWRSWQRDRTTPPNEIIFYNLVSDFQTSERDSRGLYGNSFAQQLNGSTARDLFTFDRAQPNLPVTLTRLICDTYLRENGVAQGDRLSMASSIELRLPLLDHRLVETVIGLRKAQNDAAQPAKSWLRAAVKDLLPEWVMQRRKRGFSPPVHQWHRALFDAHGEALRDGYLYQKGVLSSAGAKHLASGSFPSDVVTPLSFKALVLEQWCRQMLNS